MGIFRKLFGKADPPKRVRICNECGMPVGEPHKSWCSVFRTEQERAQKTANRPDQ